MGSLYVGIDLAKNVLAVHGVNESGQPRTVRPSVVRARLHELIDSMPPCVIGLEACSGAHHWARLFMAHGHTVRMIAQKFVVPYRLSGKRGKNDATYAAAICDTVQRPNMRFVPVKTNARQAQLCVHRARQAFMDACTSSLNRNRGFISEFGIVLPLKVTTARRGAALRLEDLPGQANLVIGDPFRRSASA